MARKHARQGSHRPSWWDSLPPRAQHLLCLTALVLVAAYFCWPTLFSGLHLVGSDTVQWRATAESMLQHREETGEEPLWATNVFGGMPGLVIVQPAKVMQIDHLFGWLRLLSWPMSHVLALLAGTYCLVWYVTKDKLLGLFAACAYGLTTYLPVILVAGHNTKYVALAYAPWLLLAFIHTMRRPGLLSGLLFAVAASVSLRAGHVQISYYVGIVGLVWWLVALVSAARGRAWRPFVRSTLWLLGGLVIGLLMVTQTYWPTLEYKAFTIRGMASGGGAGALSWDYAMAWSQGWSELLTLFIADAFGGGGAQYWGPKSFTGGPHYVGGIVLALAILAVWKVRTRAVAALGIGAVLMTLFALGSNFRDLNRLMHAHFPLFDSFRVPETWLIAVVLALAVLAAIGLRYLIRAERGKAEKEEARRFGAVFVVFGALASVVLLLLIAKGAFFNFERPGEQEQYQMAIAQQAQRAPNDPEVERAAVRYVQTQLTEPREAAFSRDARRTLLMLLLAGGGVVLLRRRKISVWALQALLITLTVVDLGGVARRYFNESHLSQRSGAEARVETLRRGMIDVDQFLLNKKAEAGGMGSFRVLSLERADQTKNGLPSFYHESLGGYSGAKLRLYQDFLENILFDQATRGISANALDIMNTRYVIAAQPLAGTQLAFQGSQFMVLENPDALPRAALIGQYEVIADPEAAWRRMQDPSFDPRSTVILAESPTEPVAPVDSGSVAHVALERYGPREIVLSIQTDAPRLLLLSEVYYPAGWKATVDGAEATIYRADYLLRAVHVPAGSQEVVFRFDPNSYVVGRWISVTSTTLVYLAILLLGLHAWRRRR